MFHIFSAVTQGKILHLKLLWLYLLQKCQVNLSPFNLPTFLTINLSKIILVGQPCWLTTLFSVPWPLWNVPSSYVPLFKCSNVHCSHVQMFTCSTSSQFYWIALFCSKYFVRDCCSYYNAASQSIQRSFNSELIKC